MENKFQQFGLEEPIISALTMLKYMEPTKVQEKVIPEALRKHDIVAMSKTGSGKTAAFAIPLCNEVIWDDNKPSALVLEPTRELTYQVKQEIFNIGRKKRIKVPDIFGGFPIEKQILTLKQKSHIVVGTPGRVLDHLERGSLSLENVKSIVIDEADLMLDMGFIDDVKKIMSYSQKKVQIMLFSATIGDKIEELITSFMKNPTRIEIESPTLTVDAITQEGYKVENEDKFEALLKILYREIPENAMIFCGTREMVNVLFRQLNKERIKCGMLHGLVDQQERLKMVDEFRDGRFRFLIVTDVASRGIDFENITHVINYDFPTGKETYVHRIGRTGRNGKSGTAISFINSTDEKMFSAIEEYIGANIPILELPSVDQLEEGKKKFLKQLKNSTKKPEQKGAVFNRQIMKLSIGGGRKSKMRAVDIVGTICSIDGLVADDIGIIDVRDSLTYVEVLNGKGNKVLEVLQTKPIKGKIRKVRKTR